MNYALDTSQAKTLGIGAVVAVLVIGLVLSLVISAIVGRVLVLVVVVAAALLIWQQRAQIESAAKKCDATFFGIHLTPSDPQLKQQCINVTNK